MKSKFLSLSCFFVLEHINLVTHPTEQYIVDCAERNFQDSINFCRHNGWTIASFQSEEEVDGVRGKVGCDAYIGAISDGYGNWKWIDDSPWWANEYNDGLEGKTETKIVWRASDNKWNDWGIGNDLEGVICKTQGMLASLLLNI